MAGVGRSGLCPGCLHPVSTLWEEDEPSACHVVSRGEFSLAHTPTSRPLCLLYSSRVLALASHTGRKVQSLKLYLGENSSEIPLFWSPGMPPDDPQGTGPKEENKSERQAFGEGLLGTSCKETWSLS